MYSTAEHRGLVVAERSMATTCSSYRTISAECGFETEQTPKQTEAQPAKNRQMQADTESMQFYRPKTRQAVYKHSAHARKKKKHRNALYTYEHNQNNTSRAWFR